MFNYFRSVLNPSAYHGYAKKGPFFEGWYYKLVDPTEQQRWCIIPGIYIGKNPADTHAFIQVMDGVTGFSIYQPYSAGQFQAAVGKFEVSLGENRFTADFMRVDITHPELTIRGELKLKGVTPWPVSVVSPGIMGWYAWVPSMECYHGVVSLDHTIQGNLVINGKAVDFSGGAGYIEKDWGMSFPKAWIWMQTNHFTRPHTCLSASAAIIPWRGHTFNGYIAGLWLDGKLYRFATYTGARLAAYQVTGTQAHMALEDRTYRLELTAQRADGGNLQAPTTMQMDRRITETLSASVAVSLAQKKAGRWVEFFADTGRYAGLEVMGTLEGW